MWLSKEEYYQLCNKISKLEYTMGCVIHELDLKNGRSEKFYRFHKNSVDTDETNELKFDLLAKKLNMKFNYDPKDRHLSYTLEKVKKGE